MNELKYACGEDTQAAYEIKYLVIDIRGEKRANKAMIPEKIEQAFTRNGKQKSRVAFYTLEFTDSFHSELTNLAVAKYPLHHLVLLMPASVEDMFVRHP